MNNNIIKAMYFLVLEYEQKVGDGQAKNFYEWCLARYDIDDMESEKTEKEK
jgi:hypothetical protein